MDYGHTLRFGTFITPSTAQPQASVQLAQRWDDPAQHFDGLYLSFESRTGEQIVAEAFPPATLRRLRAIKAEVDPDFVFRDNFGVAAEPAPLG